MLFMEGFLEKRGETEEEQKKFILETLGREEYRDGTIPLEFRHTFSNQTSLSATQNKDGIAKIVLEREGVPLLDMKGLLPEGYDYTTPRYVLDHEDELSVPVFLGTWGAYRPLNMVHVGDWTKPEQIFNLLHEIGHTQQDTVGLEALQQEVNQKQKISKFRESAEGQRLLRQWVEALSKSERDAWASAIHYAKKIRDEFDVDFIGEIFKTSEDIELYIQKILHTYKEVQKSVEWADGGEFLKKLFDKGV